MLTTNATTYNCSMTSTPAKAASGMVTSASARPASAAIKIGRRGKRSTHAPATRLVRNAGARPAAASTLIWNGVACSTRIAVKLSAVPPIIEPNTEIVWPVHSRMKSAWRHRPVRRPFT
jgi:hypothetical protein